MRAAVLLVVCAVLEAHQFHYSKTEINWNTAAKTLEIIATLHADDIEAELRKGSPGLELDRDAEAERKLCAYVTAALELTRLRPRCIGAKVSRDFVDVYLEARVETAPASLTNRILAAEIPDQRNDVELKKNGKLCGPRIQFNSSETKKAVRW